ncbi:unnamed protein product [Calypogeia fissa]
MVGQKMEKRKRGRDDRGGGGGGGKGRGGAKRPEGNSKRKFRGKKVEENEEIQALEARIEAGAPLPGTNPLASSLPKEVGLAGKDGKPVDPLQPYVGAKYFEQLPLSDRSKRGLKNAKYTHMTAIQRAALPHCLCGRDVLGAAKTGSGKTLAFLLPVVEKLYRLRWGADDGLGAIIISPTRELAFQIFEELRKVGKHHSLSAGLLIGGRKDVDTEKEHVGRLNILVCTPGRLLQHMDETPSFDASQLQVLVLDEADRILDMGFAGTLNAIVAQLSKERQTLLFSATQTRSVQDLARLSLVDPEYLAVHAESTAATPARLQQTGMIVPLDEKMNMLWSFVKTHLRFKTLVFLSSCKQVKFVHEAFKKMRPGVPVKCLHGRMKQQQRSLVFQSFCETKHSLLFCTDVAARGLDFPSVDWVVQTDCPEDVATYIHRVGRTARYTAAGRSLLFLMPSEEKFLTELEAAKVPMKVIKPNKSKVQSVSGTLAGLLSKDTALKYLAQRAFVTYLRSIYLHSNKEVFDVTKLPLAEYALSLGLPTTPRVRFLKKRGGVAKGAKGAKQDDSDSGEDEESDDENAEEIPERIEQETETVSKMDKKKSKLDRLFNRKNMDVLSTAHEKNRAVENGSDKQDDSDEEFLSKKRPREDTKEIDPQIRLEKSSGVKVMKNKKLKIDSGKAGSKRLVFDEEGNALPPLAALARDGKEETEDTPGIRKQIAEAAGERFQRLKEEMKKRDKEDRLLEKQRLREKRMKMKRKAREASVDSEEDGPRLGSGSPSQRDASDSEEEDGPKYQKSRSSRGQSSDEDVSGSEEDLDSEDESRQRHSNIASKKDSPGRKVSKLSLEEQEALALKLLGTKG